MFEQQLTTNDVAKILKCEPRKISNLCIRGEFKGAYKLGASWRIPPESLAHFIKEKQSLGAKKIK